MDQTGLHPSNDASFAAQTTTYTGTAGTVTGWGEGPAMVLVWTTTDAYIAVGWALTATTSHTPIPAYTPVKFFVPRRHSGSTDSKWSVSAIQISAGGSVYAKPLESG